jgi:hypothetical protein
VVSSSSGVNHLRGSAPPANLHSGLDVTLKAGRADLLVPLFVLIDPEPRFDNTPPRRPPIARLAGLA